MPRWFVYINITETHITIHPEKRKPCKFIAPHIKKGGVYSNNFPIEHVADNIIITGKTENSYWVIIWANSLEEVGTNNYLKKIASELGVKIEKCNSCS